MDGKEAIINSIISEAEKKAEGIVNDALAEKDALLQQTRNSLERERQQRIRAAKEQAERAAERKLTLAALDGRKQLLAAKQAVIDKVYEAAIIKMLNMTDNVYREFIGELVKRYADDGDEIMISERDAKRLNYDWATSLGAAIGKDLTLSGRQHKGKGGIVLVGYKCDKNLTFETIVKQLRSSTEGEIAARLFK